MSPARDAAARSAMVLSTTPAGTISQTARGFAERLDELRQRGGADGLFLHQLGHRLVPTCRTPRIRWPPFSRRRTMLAPIRPRPIIPNCMLSPPEDRFRPSTSFEEIDELAIAPRDLGRQPARASPSLLCQATSGSQKTVRPTAKPMKPGTLRGDRRASPAPSDRPRRGRARCSRHGRGRRPAPPPRSPRNPRGDRDLRSSRGPARRRPPAARGWPRPSGAAGPRRS